MKTKKSKGNILLGFLSIVAICVCVISLIEMVASSYISVTDDYGKNISGMVTYSERVDVGYENSWLFKSAIRDGIADVTRMCVIRNQMETGGKYDPNKSIDITAFANRAKTISDTGATAQYKLDDLVKWGNYGYDYQVVIGTNAQLDSYFYALQSKDRGTIAASGDTVHVDSYDGDITGAVDDSMTTAQEYEASTESGTHTMYILVDRYKTVDGKSLISKANNREEYEILVNNLCASADGLFSNYTEYTEYTNQYENGHTNLFYCYQLTDDEGKSVRFSNLADNITVTTNDELSKRFTSFGRYICFNPDKLQLASNIDCVDAVYMKQVLGDYEYAFRDGSRIWIAVDDNYPVADIFKKSADTYNNIGDTFIPSCIALVCSVIILMILIVAMTIQTGRAVASDSEGNKEYKWVPGKWDTVPIEIYLVITGIIVGLFTGSMGYTARYFLDSIRMGSNTDRATVLILIETLFAGVILIPLYLMFVRKIKCKLIWKGSIVRFICLKIRDCAIDFYDNGQLITRTWLPFLLFLALNLVLVLTGAVGILIAFALDIIVGIWLYKETKTREYIVEGITNISDGDIKHKLDVSGMHGDNLALANAVNNIGDGISKAVETSMKDEKMKADLITNVSHDIKTPLTSIINFVDLLKRENIEDEKIRGYIDVLDQKSQRLKALTNDLVEASKISSGNISLSIDKINLVELINQSVGEFVEKFEEKGLVPVTRLPEEPVYVMLDSRGIYRVVENLYNNIYKYALENTRVYIDMMVRDGRVEVSIKNISAEQIGVDSEDLTERFIRGDASRRTEGSGLGLSIAKSLTEAMNGEFKIGLDGDLFKVTITFDVA